MISRCKIGDQDDASSPARMDEKSGISALWVSAPELHERSGLDCVEHKLTMLHKKRWMAYVSGYCG